MTPWYIWEIDISSKGIQPTSVHHKMLWSSPQNGVSNDAVRGFGFGIVLQFISWNYPHPGCQSPPGLLYD